MGCQDLLVYFQMIMATLMTVTTVVYFVIIRRSTACRVQQVRYIGISGPKAIAGTIEFSSIISEQIDVNHFDIVEIRYEPAFKYATTNW